MRSRIFIAMLAIILVMLIFLWLSQTVFLSTFYEFAKKFDAYSVSNSIKNNVDEPSDELSALAKKLSSEHEECIKIVNITRGYSVVEDCDIHASNFNCILHKITPSKQLYDNWLEGAEANNGFYVEVLSRDKFDNSEYNPGNYEGKVPSNNHNECIISIRSTTNSNGDTILIVQNSSIEPVHATVSTIRYQLVAVTVIMIFAAFIIAFIVSKHMASPIVDINEKASELAKGNYDVRFEERGTVESIELAKTLNFAVSELSKLDKLQKDLIANISHDLRTPLTMISGYSEVM